MAEITLSPEQRQNAAREAFNGNNEALSDFIKQSLSYVENNKTYPANGYSLKDAFEVVKGMEARQLVTEFGEFGDQIMCYNCEAVYNEMFLTGCEETELCVLCNSDDIHDLYDDRDDGGMDTNEAKYNGCHPLY